MLLYIEMSEDVGNERTHRETTQTTTPERDHEALDDLAHLLREPDWAASLLEDVAHLIQSTGRDLTNYADDPPIWARH